MLPLLRIDGSGLKTEAGQLGSYYDNLSSSSWLMVKKISMIAGKEVTSGWIL